LCYILKEKYPEIFPAKYSPKNLNASLSKELDKEDSLFVREGNGYYTVKTPKVKAPIVNTSSVVKNERIIQIIPADNW